MIKTSTLTKTIFNHQPHSQLITFHTPSTTSSSGSTSETDPSSLSSSYKSNSGTNGINVNDDINSIPQDKSTFVLAAVIDKLKRELTTVKQAKSQLETLYKVKCKSDLEKAAKITKLRLQYEHELSTFCKQDQQDLVRYLQRQLISRDQRIAEQSYDIENLKNLSVPDSIDNNNNNNNNNNPNIYKKIASIQILRSSDLDVITLTNQHAYDKQEQALERQNNIELHDRVKRFDRQIEILKQDQPKDHDKELIKRALAKQAIEYKKVLKQKNDELEELNLRLEKLSKSNVFESALRQANIEKLYLERRLLASTLSSSSSSLNSKANARVKICLLPYYWR
ncbi:unnamed protein product [Rotaria socialis]|uniref:Uncharacterized protein n=1 Tax=Rotaria socialis TaxID=392032 RepID=A0A820H1M1_9BILA|nr:unnamed protein product [Rotaria socialis]CAF3480192.1 unnamed protein product [Rotaria socialis]CAF4286323.1 unnamed protein product [Rotaria socialis]CAF4292804.1 unnamed protein product [Rotaria socialis]CAF4512243.1 unnamed protein product [Rotaria socialis]